MKPARTDIKELKSFGLLVGGILAFIFGLALPMFLHGTINVWLWGAGGLLMAAGIAVPAALRPIHAAWMRLGHVLGWINTRIILGVFFFCILMPAGIIMRLLGRDPMNRKFDADAVTYRVPARVPAASHFERPF